MSTSTETTMTTSKTTITEADARAVAAAAEANAAQKKVGPDCSDAIGTAKQCVTRTTIAARVFRGACSDEVARMHECRRLVRAAREALGRARRADEAARAARRAPNNDPRSVWEPLAAAAAYADGGVRNDTPP